VRHLGQKNGGYPQVKRRNHKPEFKAKVVVEVLREELSINEIAAKYELNPNLVRRWKSEAIDNMATVFEDKNKKANKLKKEYEKKINNMYNEIGKLTIELSWIKKKAAQFNL
jgi:transposase